MADYGSTDRVRQSAVQRYIGPARINRQSNVTIEVGTFEKALVREGLLQPNRFPIVCNALKSRRFLSENHLQLVHVQAPPSGQSSTVSYTYKLEPETRERAGALSPSGSGPGTASGSAPAGFPSLRGLLRKTYEQLGGAEKFHRTERESWDR